MRVYPARVATSSAATMSTIPTGARSPDSRGDDYAYLIYPDGGVLSSYDGTVNYPYGLFFSDRGSAIQAYQMIGRYGSVVYTNPNYYVYHSYGKRSPSTYGDYWAFYVTSSGDNDNDYGIDVNYSYGRILRSPKMNSSDYAWPVYRPGYTNIDFNDYVTFSYGRIYFR